MAKAVLAEVTLHNKNSLSTNDLTSKSDNKHEETQQLVMESMRRQQAMHMCSKFRCARYSSGKDVCYLTSGVKYDCLACSTEHTDKDSI